MSEPNDELQRCLARLENVWFSSNWVAWLKAVRLSELADQTYLKDPCQFNAMLEQSRLNPCDPNVHAELIQFFVSEWIGYMTPEESGTHGFDVSQLQAAARLDALQTVDRMLAYSQSLLDECDEKENPEFGFHHMEYTVLRAIYTNDLFKDGDSWFYTCETTDPVTLQKWGPADDVVFAVSREVIAMMWMGW